MWDWWQKNRTLILSGILLLVVLLWYSVNLRQKPETNFIETLILRMTGPVQASVDQSIRWAANIWGRYIFLIDTEEENRILQEENRELKSKLAADEEVRLENDRLRRLLDFKVTQELESLPARIVAEDATSWFRTITIDKGSEEGVAEGMPVVVAEGVVGRIVRSSSHFSRVLLITDASSAVGALLQDNRARGICRGKGDRLVFDFVNRQEDVVIGDSVITSGMGGVFPKGLTIGSVNRVEREDLGLFQEVEVLPSVDFSHLEEVLILLRSNQ